MVESESILAILAKATTKSSGSSLTILLLVGLFAIFYFLVIRPRSQRQRAARNQVKAAEVGDEVQTIGGLVGTIVAEDGDRVTISTGNGTELTYLRQAIGKKIERQSDSEPPGFEDPAPDPTTDTDRSGDAEEPGQA